MVNSLIVSEHEDGYANFSKWCIYFMFCVKILLEKTKERKGKVKKQKDVFVSFVESLVPFCLSVLFFVYGLLRTSQ